MLNLITAVLGRNVKVEKLNVLVFGAGAIGTYIGGSLSSAGHHVVFLEQPGTAQELRIRGLQLDLKKAQGLLFTISPAFFWRCRFSL